MHSLSLIEQIYNQELLFHPRFDNMFDQLQGASFFSKIDLNLIIISLEVEIVTSLIKPSRLGIVTRICIYAIWTNK